ncbi:GGDEF domain-containing protein [Devosia chinhatensis]|uniref:diguanylate cyclase n=1 Tax=Devosia chinhatensis TaxID=429727 RepID=A0A0F5FLF5_9HYPH|nr:GGDEF domain-containing protein [Devosia chinhatensis]KKB09628.1 hypothetical protein VE26_07065 [Devosia chinhatensis]
MSGQFYFSLLNPAIALTFATVFLMLWRRFPDRHHLIHVVFAFALCAIGFTVRDFPVFLNELSTRLVANFAFIGSAMLACGAALALASRTIPWTRMSLISGIGLVVFGYFLFVVPSTTTRVVVLGITMSLLAFTAVVELWKARPLPLSGRLILSAALIFMVLALSRPLLILSGLLAIDDAATFQQSSYWLTIQAFTPLLAGALALLFLAAMSIDTFEQLRTEANHDYLTGLLNRRGFEVAASGCLSEGGGTGALLMGDIDDFKKINDTYGHKVGDQVISAMARALSSHGRAQFAARVGGEEFALFYRDGDLEALHAHADRIRSAVNRLVLPGLPADYPLTMSIGIHARSANETLSEMLIEADRALYRAKTSGKDQAVTSAASKRRSTRSRSA